MTSCADRFLGSRKQGGGIGRLELGEVEQVAQAKNLEAAVAPGDEPPATQLHQRSVDVNGCAIQTGHAARAGAEANRPLTIDPDQPVRADQMRPPHIVSAFTIVALSDTDLVQCVFQRFREGAH